MLIQAFVVVTVLAMLAGLSVSTSMYLVQVERAQIIGSTLAALADSGIEDARGIVAAQAASPATVPLQAAPAPRVTTLPVCGIGAGNCTVRESETFMVAKDQSVAMQIDATPQPCSSAANDVADANICNLQTGGNLQESRTTVTVGITLLDVNGAILASTDRIVRLRTFTLPPYAVVVGVSLPHSTAQADVVADAGGLLATPSPISQAAAATVLTAVPPLIPCGVGMIDCGLDAAYVLAANATPTPAPVFTPSTVNAVPGTAVDSLIRSYAPCRVGPTGIQGGVAFDNWEGTNGANADVVACTPNAGDTSQFINERIADPQPTNNWSM